MGNVELISYTQAVNRGIGEELDSLQDIISYCARVSNPSNQMNHETSDKLINYLIKHKHWSPFEMVSATIMIEGTRDITRQLLRHRSFTFQEFSQRYANPVDDLTFEIRECRLQHHKNRQLSVDSVDKKLNDEWTLRQNQIIMQVTDAYNWAIENGIAKEQARVVLPEGNTMSRLYVSGSIRSWIHYIEIRTDKDTQKEHRELALSVAKVISDIFPLINQFNNRDG